MSPEESSEPGSQIVVRSTDARKRRLAQVLVLGVFLAATGVLLLWLDVGGRNGGSAAVRGPVAITAALTDRMRVTLEHLPLQQHQGHAGVGTGPTRLVCGTRVYGYEPADAATVDDVVTIYGFHLCAQVEAGRTWDWTTKLVGPLVMRLDTRPPAVQIAESSAAVTYRDRVRQLFPVRYRKAAFEQALGPGQLADMRHRYEAAVGPVTAAAG